MLKRIPFIRPMAPTLTKTPPTGPEWSHEVKFDGWRAQIHLDDGEATIFSKGGSDLTKRFRALRPVLDQIPARRAILDCELVACGPDGMPCFKTLMAYRKTDAPLCLWAFDLLALDGVRLLPLPLYERRARLADLITATVSEHIQCSGAFDDPMKLLATCERMGLEGIVSKKRDAPYRPGPTRAWLKTKTVSWREANRDRWEQFVVGCS